MKKATSVSIKDYNKSQSKHIKEICDYLELNINNNLKNAESKIWHGTPVWFVDGNPVVSYSVRRSGVVSLMFFSGQSFKEKDLMPIGKFKAAETLYANLTDIKITHLKKWLTKAKDVQWNYKDIVKMKGVLKKVVTVKKRAGK